MQASHGTGAVRSELSHRVLDPALNAGGPLGRATEPLPITGRSSSGYGSLRP